jgi:molybdenum cofactor biosynthesis enzyme
MAKRATNPQDIQAIQKSLVTGVQNGSIQPYVGIPLIQELTKKLTEAKAHMAQNIAGAGMQQPPQGGPPQQPIAQQVMQQAAQGSQGLEALPSNLPQEYAGGGIIAFEDGGQVERYQNRGYTGDPMGGGGSEIMGAAGTSAPYVGRNFLEGLLSVPEEPEWKRKLREEQAIKERDMVMGVKPPATPAADGPIVPYGQSKAPANLFGGATPPSSIPGGGGFKMPTLPTMKETPAPTLTDYNTLIGDMPAKAKAASEAAVKSAQTELEGFDKPGFETREGRLSQREAGLEKDSAITRALNTINLGFKVAGSKERTLAGALGKEGAEGIQALIQGEAANRAAKDRLDDARDNFEQQKVAAKKGNYQAAQAAGKDASRDLQAATQLTMTGAHYGNSESLQRYQTQQQGEFQKTSLGQSGILGLRELDVKERQLAQNAATANAQLQLGREKLDIIKGQIASGDKRAQAALAGAEQKAYTAFRQDPQTMKLYKEIEVRFGPNYMQNPQAQAQLQQAARTYMMNAVPSLLGAETGGNIPSFNDLNKAME